MKRKLQARENYQCEQCGYPLGEGDSMYFIWDDLTEIFCAHDCMERWKEDYDNNHIEAGGEYPCQNLACFL